MGKGSSGKKKGGGGDHADNKLGITNAGTIDSKEL